MTDCTGSVYLFILSGVGGPHDFLVSCEEERFHYCLVSLDGANWRHHVSFSFYFTNIGMVGKTNVHFSKTGDLVIDRKVWVSRSIICA